MKFSSSILAACYAGLCMARLGRLIPRDLSKDQDPVDPMYQLSVDEDFHFEIIRMLGIAPYEGADIAEVLMAIKDLKEKDMSTFSDSFYKLATHVDERAKAIDSCKHPVSARNAFFRAATYYRAADFYLHGNSSDPRIDAYWKLHRSAFDKALNLMDIPGKRTNLTSTDSNITIPAIFYSSGKPGPRPTIILCNGYDGSQEELYHFLGKSALERGYNVITYEGPGQPTVRRDQGLGFIPDWEKIGVPVIDYAASLTQVDKSAMVVMGVSLGGYLATRIAAFDNRPVAVVAIDGIYDYHDVLTCSMNPKLLEILNKGDKSTFNNLVMKNKDNLDTTARWGLDQGLWSFKSESPFDYYTMAKSYTLTGLTDKIKAPVFIGDPEQDIFFQGQPKMLAKPLGANGTLFSYNTADAAHLHCSEGATVYLSQTVYDWLDKIVSQ
ncbi:hypothetical protein VHEMI01480 [[Torrubiella] hemipterigena]|uniref:AB hydrolase-1 domain-containing protein n=1 Tax=[Torrubiella] hemipterigena TaxID=1531966 RepID=A0A0A1T4V9_9HYPO|nr:hypothetical protein VHEMI01480 [[Torrubiella] hemipterigena]